MSATTHQVGGSNEPLKGQLIGDVVAGGGMGLLVGVLLGLSVAQAVGGVIAALSALIGAFLGLTGGGGTRSWRIGGFGLACVIGVLLGLFGTLRRGAGTVDRAGRGAMAARRLLQGAGTVLRRLRSPGR